MVHRGAIAGLLLLVMLNVGGCTEPNPDHDRHAGQDLGTTPLPDGELIPHRLDDDGAPQSCGDAAGCTKPPGPCYEQTGSCDPQTGSCTYAPLAKGTACIPWDMCLQPGTCDGKGTCVADPVSCELPHTSGGTCAEGACHGYTCDAGWGDCNGVWTDGCEQDITGDVDHCGACTSPCGTAANATVSCVQGKCQLNCTAPYKDCNELFGDGCEIPVGQPNACDRVGLSTFTTAAGATPGCGTPYCGKGGSKDESFGTWYCTFCSHCQLFADGGAWCLTSKGTFSADRCTDCCNPLSPQYPQQCQP
jgi:hypothetical protein